MEAGLRVLTTLAAGLATVLLGALVGLLGSFHHASTVSVAGVRWPVGVLAALLALVLAQLVVRDALPFGVGPALVLVSWTAVVATLGTTRPEGDLVVAAGGSGSAFLYGGFLLGIVVTVTLAVRGSGRRPSATGPAPERR